MAYLHWLFFFFVNAFIVEALFNSKQSLPLIVHSIRAGHGLEDPVCVSNSGKPRNHINSKKKKSDFQHRAKKGGVLKSHIDVSTTKKPKISRSMADSSMRVMRGIAENAAKVTKRSFKNLFDLFAAKHVSQNQIYGKWRLNQEVDIGKGMIVNCPATIEFREDGSAVTIFADTEHKADFLFKERSWPRKCSIRFHAQAFQGPDDLEPVKMFYKGTFKRSIMNPNTLLIRGKIYRISGKLMWKRQTKCGKFKASLRRYQ